MKGHSMRDWKIIITLTILTLAAFGCETFKGACNDTAWMLKTVGDNISTESDGYAQGR